MGRKRKYQPLTIEQVLYRESLTRKRLPEIKKPVPEQIKPALPGSLEVVMEKQLVYLGNCIFWVNEYLEGRTDIQRCYSALNSLAVAAITIRNEIKVHNPNIKL